jgi:hypothetical protein
MGRKPLARDIRAACAAGPGKRDARGRAQQDAAITDGGVLLRAPGRATKGNGDAEASPFYINLLWVFSKRFR